MNIDTMSTVLEIKNQLKNIYLVHFQVETMRLIANNKELFNSVLIPNNINIIYVIACIPI